MVSIQVIVHTAVLLNKQYFSIEIGLLFMFILLQEVAVYAYTPNFKMTVIETVCVVNEACSICGLRTNINCCNMVKLLSKMTVYLHSAWLNMY